MSGPCLSPSVADHPLRPATRLGLGGPLPRQQADRPRSPPCAPGPKVPGFGPKNRRLWTTCGINPPFGGLSPAQGKVLHVLRTRSPLSPLRVAPSEIPSDLHVLTTPPAFILSQDQTLRQFNGTQYRHRVKEHGIPTIPSTTFNSKDFYLTGCHRSGCQNTRSIAQNKFQRTKKHPPVGGSWKRQRKAKWLSCLLNLVQNREPKFPN